MKAYGIPRLPGVEWPDKADIKEFGLSSSDRCSRADRGKRKARRAWKKRFRIEQDRQLRAELIFQAILYSYAP